MSDQKESAQQPFPGFGRGFGGSNLGNQMNGSFPGGNSPFGNMNSFMSPGGMNSFMSPGGMNAFVPSGGMNAFVPPGGINAYMSPGGMNAFVPPGGMNAFMPPGVQSGFVSPGGTTTSSPAEDVGNSVQPKSGNVCNPPKNEDNVMPSGNNFNMSGFTPPAGFPPSGFPPSGFPPGVLSSGGMPPHGLASGGMAPSSDGSCECGSVKVTRKVKINGIEVYNSCE